MAVMIALGLTSGGSSSVGAVDHTDKDDGDVQEGDYITAQGVVGLCVVHDGLNIGNVCFSLNDEKRVHIEIEDEFFDVVRGSYRFFEGDLGLGEDPKMLDEGWFCTQESIDVPEGADHVVVFVDGHVGTAWFCDELQGATMGTIRMTEY